MVVDFKKLLKKQDLYLGARSMSEVDVVETDTKSETLEVEDPAAREGMEDTAASAFTLVRTEDRGSPPFLPTSSAGRPVTRP